MPLSCRKPFRISTLRPHKVSRGRHAWSRIKATAAEQRELWRIVGEALLVGRKLNPSNQAFGKWCIEMGFDMDARVRSDAMWFAESVFQSLEHDLTHPTAIRQYAKKMEQAASLPADLADAQATKVETAKFDSTRSAEKFAKVDRMAEFGEGPEAEVAKGQRDAIAKKHVVTTGRIAWVQLKASAEEQREWWCAVGEALLVGRRKHPSNQAFGAWLATNGFDDLKRTTRADAMWLVGFFFYSHCRFS